MSSAAGFFAGLAAGGTRRAGEVVNENAADGLGKAPFITFPASFECLDVVALKAERDNLHLGVLHNRTKGWRRL